MRNPRPPSRVALPGDEALPEPRCDAPVVVEGRTDVPGIAQVERARAPIAVEALDHVGNVSVHVVGHGVAQRQAPARALDRPRRPRWSGRRTAKRCPGSRRCNDRARPRSRRGTSPRRPGTRHHGHPPSWQDGTRRSSRRTSADPLAIIVSPDHRLARLPPPGGSSPSRPPDVPGPLDPVRSGAFSAAAAGERSVSGISRAAENIMASQ